MAAHATRFTDAAFTLVVACGGPMLDAQNVERVADFSGTRMEEAAQLKTDDVRAVHGIAVINIRQGEGQHLKNLSARRTLPIHDGLVAPGFLKLVALRRAQGETRLSPASPAAPQV